VPPLAGRVSTAGQRGRNPRGDSMAPCLLCWALLRCLPCLAAWLGLRCVGWAVAHASIPRPPAPPEGQHSPGDTRGRAQEGGTKPTTAERGNTPAETPACRGANHQKAPFLRPSQGGPPSQKPGGGRAEERSSSLARGTCFWPLIAPNRDGHCRGAQGGR
jgi:hypothetical protein